MTNLNRSEKNKIIAKNTLFLYGRMIFVLLVSLYTTRAILNALGVVDYGVYNVVAGFVTMFAFINTSMSNGIQRFYSYTIGEDDKPQLVRIFNTSLQIQLFIAIIAIVALETVGLWYVNNKMVIPGQRFSTAIWIYQFSIISLVLVILQIPFSAAVIAHEKMDFFAMISIVDAVAKLAVAILIPYINADKLFFYGIFMLGITCLNYMLYFIYSKLKFEEIKIDIRFDKPLFFSMLTFSGWNLFGTFSFMLRAQGLTVLLNFYYGTVVNAAQGVASQIQSAIQGFSHNIVTAFRPQMVQSYAEGDYSRVTSMFYSLSKISYIMLFMLSLPVSMEINYILHLWLGDTIPEYASTFTKLVLANMVLLSLHTPIVTIIHATGRMQKFQIITGIITCLIIPFSWFALKFGGRPEIVYWISLFVQMLNQFICLIILLEVFPYNLKDYFKFVIWPILEVSIPVLVCEFGVIKFLDESLVRVALTCAVSIVVTCMMAYFTATTEEKNIITQLFKYK